MSLVGIAGSQRLSIDRIPARQLDLHLDLHGYGRQIDPDLVCHQRNREGTGSGDRTMGPNSPRQLLATGCESKGIALCFIQPGKPHQSVFIERFNKLTVQRRSTPIASTTSQLTQPLAKDARYRASQTDSFLPPNRHQLPPSKRSTEMSSTPCDLHQPS